MTKTALVAGASGIVGSATVDLLLQDDWEVPGLSRRPTLRPGLHPIIADLQDAAATASALAGFRPDAVFVTTWLRQDSEAENIRVNRAMVRRRTERADVDRKAAGTIKAGAASENRVARV